MIQLDKTTQLELFNPKDRQRFNRHAAAILARLRQGPMTNGELSDNTKYGCNPRARVSELRQAGYVIEVERKQGGLSVYRLL